MALECGVGMDHLSDGVWRHYVGCRMVYSVGDKGAHCPCHPWKALLSTIIPTYGPLSSFNSVFLCRIIFLL